MEAGYGFQVFWAVLGIVLVYYFICARKEKLLIWLLAILIFFSGLDIIGQYLIGTDLSTLPNTQHIEWWAVPYQYSSMTTQLYWVFNQAIPAWLCTIFAYMQKDNKKEYLLYWKDTFTLQNVLGGGIVGIISFLYLSANVSGQRIMAESSFVSYANHLSKYMMFILVEVGIYFSLLYKINKNNKLYYFLLFCFCIIPPIKVGNAEKTGM